ncbi:hypothetical protein JEY40_12870 [Bradyrhizobium japonicum]|uniref:hypothetical protein n=1 Tax=Bradyrhizobium TaxID=374 RepID=UPI00200F48C9|nr:hypothetical protein [Bradyrhizobium japonicum]UQD75338.1 hypothetical protein JEY40_12870 [Bradyrhizobium japonicum]
MLDGAFGWRLDAGDERRRVRPGTRKRWTTGAGRSAGGPAGSATCDGSTGGAARDGASRCAGISSSGHAAATGHGAESGASHDLTATAPGPVLRCTATASRPARGGAAT